METIRQQQKNKFIFILGFPAMLGDVFAKSCVRTILLLIEAMALRLGRNKNNINMYNRSSLIMKNFWNGTKGTAISRFPITRRPWRPASFPVVLGDFGCDVTCQACRENSPRISRYRAGFQASSGHSDSANRPGYEATWRLVPNRVPNRELALES